MEKVTAAGLVVFPETFVPPYPDWVWRSTPWGTAREWFGRLGGLTCWEHYMPLARYAMYAKGVDVWAAPTWDTSDVWVPTLRHLAKEGRMYVIGVAPLLRGSDVPADLPGRDELYGGEEDWLSRGLSTIVGPRGEVLAGPLVEQEGILYAELDAARARAARMEFDPVGHYARPDVFRLLVDTRQQLSTQQDPAADGPPADHTAAAGPRPDQGGASHAR